MTINVYLTELKLKYLSKECNYLNLFIFIINKILIKMLNKMLPC